MCRNPDELLRKSDALDGGGFIFDCSFGTYVNRSKRMLFSHHFVDARSAEELEQHIAHATPTGEWQLFCLEPPAPEVRQEVIAAYSRHERKNG